MQEFNGAENASDAFGGEIDQNYVGTEGLSFADDGITRGKRQRRVGADSAGDAGAVNKHLEDGALVIVGGEDGNG